VDKRFVKDDPRRLEVRDAAVMRALAHPARIAILQHLFDGNAGTATELAEVCGLSPSATSYHLRALAKVELIEEAPSRGDARERVWQTAIRGFNILAGPESSAAEQAAERELTAMFMDLEDARAREWLTRRDHESQEWYEASTYSSIRLKVSVDELRVLNEEILAMLGRYSSHRADAPDDARMVHTSYRSFPAAE
jgi:DNA-binding transcriptional ArsR family regulator